MALDTTTFAGHEFIFSRDSKRPPPLSLHQMPRCPWLAGEQPSLRRVTCSAAEGTPTLPNHIALDLPNYATHTGARSGPAPGIARNAPPDQGPSTFASDR